MDVARPELLRARAAHELLALLRSEGHIESAPVRTATTGAPGTGTTPHDPNGDLVRELLADLAAREDAALTELIDALGRNHATTRNPGTAETLPFPWHRPTPGPTTGTPGTPGAPGTAQPPDAESPSAPAPPSAPGATTLPTAASPSAPASERPTTPDLAEIRRPDGLAHRPNNLMTPPPAATAQTADADELAAVHPLPKPTPTPVAETAATELAPVTPLPRPAAPARPGPSPLPPAAQTPMDAPGAVAADAVTGTSPTVIARGELLVAVADADADADDVASGTPLGSTETGPLAAPVAAWRLGAAAATTEVVAPGTGRITGTPHGFGLTTTATLTATAPAAAAAAATAVTSATTDTDAIAATPANGAALGSTPGAGTPAPHESDAARLGLVLRLADGPRPTTPHLAMPAGTAVDAPAGATAAAAAAAGAGAAPQAVTDAAARDAALLAAAAAGTPARTERTRDAKFRSRPQRAPRDDERDAPQGGGADTGADTGTSHGGGHGDAGPGEQQPHTTTAA